MTFERGPRGFIKENSGTWDVFTISKQKTRSVEADAQKCLCTSKPTGGVQRQDCGPEYNRELLSKSGGRGTVLFLRQSEERFSQSVHPVPRRVIPS